MNYKAILFPLAVITAGAAHGVSFVDGTFSDSDWTMETFPTSLTGQFTEQISAGGNPGAYKRVATINNNFTYNAHLRTAFIYDPSVSGAINSIDWSIDFKNFSAFGAGQGYGLVLKQSGILYRGSFFATGTVPTLWQTNGQSALTSSNFTEGISGATNPDFSSSGSAITFGFTTNNGDGATIDIGYDNYRVDVTPVPEPATMAVLGLGVASLLRRRKKV